MSTDDQNGQSEWDGVDVDRLAVSGNGTADGYNFGGQHNVHIAVISECNWSINVLAMPSKADRGQHSPGLPHTEAAVDTQSRASHSRLLQRSRAMGARLGHRLRLGVSRVVPLGPLASSSSAMSATSGGPPRPRRSRPTA